MRGLELLEQLGRNRVGGPFGFAFGAEVVGLATVQSHVQCEQNIVLATGPVRVSAPSDARASFDGENSGFLHQFKGIEKNALVSFAVSG